MIRRTRLTVALCAAIVVTRASACGPDFPNEVLADREHTLLHLPEGAFQVEVARIAPKPDARFVPNETQEFWDPENAQSALRDSAEQVGLSEAERAQVATLRGATDAAAAFAAGEGLADDLRHYVAGAVAWHQDDLAVARDHFERTLAANTAADARRASWAQFMLARIAALEDDATVAAAAFAKVRERVAAGAPDPLGLAVASFGEEAALQLDAETPAALHLYLEQAATGSTSGANSVLMLTRAAFADAELLKSWVADPLARRVAVAYAFSRAGELATDDPAVQDDEMGMGDPYRIGQTTAIARLLDAIDAAPQADSAGLDRLAAVAYRAGRFDLAERLVAKDDAPLSAWVRAKLALRRGDRDAAVAAYAAAARGFPRDESWGGQYALTSSWDALQPQCQVNAELGTLNLARGDVVSAMTALFDAGDRYWADTAYVAERVLSLAELRSFVQSHAPEAVTAPAEPDEATEGFSAGEPATLLRHLFARRLMRAGEYDEAERYFDDPELRDAAARYGRARQRAEHSWSWVNRVARAEAWYEAATIARTSGMELLGMEGLPDFQIWGGSFGREPGHFDDDFNWIPEPPTDVALAGDWIGSDEAARLAASRPANLSRFHYRRIAADHIQQAANFVPARSQAFAAMLCEGTGWLIDREPDAARVLYRRYVAEGPLVPFGAHFGHDCPAPQFDRARDRLHLERWRALKAEIRRKGPYVAALAVILFGAWFWRRRQATGR